MRRYAGTLLVALILMFAAAPVSAPAQEASEPLEIGAVAPDFELPAANRDGVLEEPVRLSDFEGQTVVLAFFFKARTPG